MERANSLYTVLTTIAFLIGLAGNLAALWILHKTARRRNKKHLFMLRCLATNDIVAQIGMLLLLHLLKAGVLPTYLGCSGFVLVRAFGLGSGCVAFVMALERWLALTRPFFYHQLVTYQRLKIFLCGLWLTAVMLVYMPLFGFGLYYDAQKQRCTRFRHATELRDKIYAYLFFAFGSTLCLCLAFCNTSVICELSRIRSQQRVLVRRVSRSIISNRVGCARYQTPEEVAFSKLMAVVCIIFVACWLPQLVTVPVSQFLTPSKGTQKFTAVADALLTVYFAVDPFVYVLLRYFEGHLKFCYFSKKQNTGKTDKFVVKKQHTIDISPEIPCLPHPGEIISLENLNGK
ncbi:unnamed protein product [Phaedon cochleariae]|uniref:G-protein coupled receptors family 1 profile domain-containing protein n=1 Tax=Phaedon cochleariae TaxID=80249 RepID=A0A9P0DK81_PHACE|nr:unnamed protein product [Phaedon cochleariae]